MGNLVRFLPHDEWPRLSKIGPFAEAQVMPDPDYATVLVEETPEGEIVGTWMITSIMLLEGLWRREDQRGDTIGGARLLMRMMQYLRDMQIKTAITVIQDPAVAALASKVGFKPLPGGGTLHVLEMKEI